MMNRKINKSPMGLDDPEKGYLKKLLTTPPVKKIDLHFPLGLEVTARNMKGVTIKDACDAIYKQYRKKVRRKLSLPSFCPSSFQPRRWLISPIFFLSPSIIQYSTNTTLEMYRQTTSSRPPS